MSNVVNVCEAFWEFMDNFNFIFIGNGIELSESEF